MKSRITIEVDFDNGNEPIILTTSETISSELFIKNLGAAVGVKSSSSRMSKTPTS